MMAGVRTLGGRAQNVRPHRSGGCGDVYRNFVLQGHPRLLGSSKRDGAGRFFDSHHGFARRQILLLAAHHLTRRKLPDFVVRHDIHNAVVVAPQRLSLNRSHQVQALARQVHINLGQFHGRRCRRRCLIPHQVRRRSVESGRRRFFFQRNGNRRHRRRNRRRPGRYSGCQHRTKAGSARLHTSGTCPHARPVNHPDQQRRERTSQRQPPVHKLGLARSGQPVDVLVGNDGSDGQTDRAGTGKRQALQQRPVPFLVIGQKNQQQHQSDRARQPCQTRRNQQQRRCSSNQRGSKSCGIEARFRHVLWTAQF